MCVCLSSDVSCALYVCLCLTQLISALCGCSEPDGETSDRSFASQRGLPGSLGQEEGMITGGNRRPLSCQIAFPIGNFLGYFSVGGGGYGHHCLLMLQTIRISA